MNIKKTLAAVVLAALATGACVDLEVTNPNDPDAGLALTKAGDVEALISGSFATWWLSNGSNNGVSQILNTVSYAHSGTAANFGMVEFSGWPKKPVHNQTNDVYYLQFSDPWRNHYRATAAVVDGFKAIESGKVTFPADSLSRIKAFGYFVLGLTHSSTAIMYDQGYIYDETMAIEDVELHPYKDVLAAGLGYLDKAIAEASGKSWKIPAQWISKETDAAQLVRMAHSLKARYMAASARTPADRTALNWDNIISEIDKGVTATWDIDMAIGSNFSSGHLLNLHRFGPWGQLSYQVMGMADQSGRYQRWMAREPGNRHPNLSDDQTSDPFIIITPDKRFPQGTTVETQRGRANAGTLWEMPTQSGGVGAQWNRPDRGTFRWSYYRYWKNDAWLSARGNYPEITIEEMNLLKAEGLLRKGDKAGAAALVNISRTRAGLSATDANETNTSCVPKLPNGNCGSLMEMLKWEMRLETFFKGTHLSSWYFHGRGWGDLAEGTFLELPMPGGEALLFAKPIYTFGGPGGNSSAPKGTYGY